MRTVSGASGARNERAPAGSPSVAERPSGGAFSANSRKMLEHGLAKGCEVMRAAGARRVDTVGPIRLAGWHLLGTARMGTDPQHSVVNEWGRSHDVRNLFIVDGRVFVTSGGVNPTTTIQAVALYIAAAMKRNLASLFD